MLLQYPDVHGEVDDLRPSSDGARRRLLVAVGDRSARAHAARCRRAKWAPTPSSATRSGSACRSATAGRTRRSWRRGRASCVRRPGRIIGMSVDARGQPRVPHGAADARAAHPPREGDLEHLHRAGAARQHRGDVCGLSRPGTGSAPSRERVHSLRRRARGRADRRRLPPDQRRLSSIRCASKGRDVGRGARRRPTRPASTSSTRATADRHLARRDDHDRGRRGDRRACSRRRAAGTRGRVDQGRRAVRAEGAGGAGRTERVS